MNSNEIKLGTIASISTGLVVKRKQAGTENEAVGQYPMLTLKSFEQGGWLNKRDLEVFFSSEALDAKYLTQKGDVVVRLSSPNTAVSISEEDAGILIPSLFVIIRLETDKILAEYLSIFLNSDYMKKIYTKDLVGSAIQIIKTSMLKDIDLKLKTLDMQEKIIKLNKQMLKERFLLEELLEEKTKYHNAIINKII